MKATIHPTWYPEAKVKCACGNTFTLGAAVPEIEVEVCSNCHPFYTGQMKYVDTAGRVDAFRTRQKNAQEKILSKAQRRALKKAKKLKAEMDLPDSLQDLRKSLKKAK